MATKTCINGHSFDSSIYDQCPFCPSSGNTISYGPRIHPDAPTSVNVDMDTDKTRTNKNTYSDDQHTRVFNGSSASGTTEYSPSYDDPKTVIHGAVGGTTSKKLVALLATYSSTVNVSGDIFKIYEGRTVVGRDFGCDIQIKDSELSSKHFTILCRVTPDGNRYYLKDEMTTNGTFVNGIVEDGQVELKNFDTITVGNTTFTFIIIPQ